MNQNPSSNRVNQINSSNRVRKPLSAEISSLLERSKARKPKPSLNALTTVNQLTDMQIPKPSNAQSSVNALTTVNQLTDMQIPKPSSAQSSLNEFGVSKASTVNQLPKPSVNALTTVNQLIDMQIPNSNVQQLPNVILFDYYSIGEYVLAEAVDKSIMIQARTAKLWGVSGNVAVAMVLDQETTLEYYARGDYFIINGVNQTLASGKEISLTSKGATVKYTLAGSVVNVKTSSGANLNLNGWSVKDNGKYFDISFEIPATLDVNYGYCVSSTMGAQKSGSYFYNPVKRTALIKPASVNAQIKEATPQEKQTARNACTKAGISEKDHPNDFKACYADALISPENASKFAKNMVKLQALEKVSSKQVAKEAISQMDKKDLVKLVANAAVKEAKKQDVPTSSSKTVSKALNTLSTDKLLATLEKVIDNKATVKIATKSNSSPKVVATPVVKSVETKPIQKTNKASTVEKKTEKSTSTQSSVSKPSSKTSSKSVSKPVEKAIKSVSQQPSKTVSKPVSPKTSEPVKKISKSSPKTASKPVEKKTNKSVKTNSIKTQSVALASPSLKAAKTVAKPSSKSSSVKSSSVKSSPKNVSNKKNESIEKSSKASSSVSKPSSKTSSKSVSKQSSKNVSKPVKKISKSSPKTASKPVEKKTSSVKTNSIKTQSVSLDTLGLKDTSKLVAKPSSKTSSKPTKTSIKVASASDKPVKKSSKQIKKKSKKSGKKSVRKNSKKQVGKKSIKKRSPKKHVKKSITPDQNLPVKNTNINQQIVQATPVVNVPVSVQLPSNPIQELVNQKQSSWNNYVKNTIESDETMKSKLKNYLLGLKQEITQLKKENIAQRVALEKLRAQTRGQAEQKVGEKLQDLIGAIKNI